MLGCLVGLFMQTEPAGATEPHCRDFLQHLHKKPAHLVFVGCEPGRDAQIRVLKARYRVAGADAAGVERYLHQHSKMPKLRFVCCGWEPELRGNTSNNRGTLTNLQGLPFDVIMGSAETLVADRQQWKKIDWFYVTVTEPLEEP